MRVLKYFFLIPAILLWCLDVSAFQVCETQEGVEVKWSTSDTIYYINPSGGPLGSFLAIYAAMQRWTDVATSSFNFIYGGKTTSTEHGVNDGVNTVTFGPMGLTGTLAENAIWYYVSSGHVIDSDIKFNTDYTWATDGSPSAYDIQNVGTHEFGHSLCLADLYSPSDSEKTMYGYVYRGETKKRTLDPDDLDGISYLYSADIDQPIIDGIWRRRCEPGQVIVIYGVNFGDGQGDSAVHLNKATVYSSNYRIKRWIDTRIGISIPRYKCTWFIGRDFRYVRVWVTVDGIDSNKKMIKVLKPDICP